MLGQEPTSVPATPQAGPSSVVTVVPGEHTGAADAVGAGIADGNTSTTAAVNAAVVFRWKIIRPPDPEGSDRHAGHRTEGHNLRSLSRNGRFPGGNGVFRGP
ncbi:hypothetical protein [Amycolatopsis sp. CA-128772]|uniref:hypothetical protein n=1 Tax=Amycolatopsis sp. CA-128772 TaxID=2073159 RepID=UPI001E287F7E|nr:hypothetical protein [Amycolatopsis sp. CA-128772]